VCWGLQQLQDGIAKEANIVIGEVLQIILYNLYTKNKKVGTKLQSIQLVNQKPIVEYSFDDATTNEREHNTTIYTMKV
jgi:hypothetical protein